MFSSSKTKRQKQLACSGGVYKHWEYQLFETWQEDPDWQQVGPV
jgi:hypothetical protein